MRIIGLALVASLAAGGGGYLAGRWTEARAANARADARVAAAWKDSGDRSLKTVEATALWRRNMAAEVHAECFDALNRERRSADALELARAGRLAASQRRLEELTLAFAPPRQPSRQPSAEPAGAADPARSAPDADGGDCRIGPDVLRLVNGAAEGAR